MRILMTGGTGFVGAELARRLLEKQQVVHCLTRSDQFSGNTVEGVDYVRGDITDYSQTFTALEALHPDIVVHLAAYTPVRYSYDWPAPISYAQVNYIGTVNLVEACLRAGGVKQFVYASTLEVMGPYHTDHQVDESSSPTPLSPYSVAKLAGEHYVRYAALRGLHSTVLRPTNTYGRPDTLPDEAKGYFVEKCIISMLMSPSKPISFDGSSQSKRRFMHVKDHVNGYLSAIGNLKALDRVYFVAPKEPATTLEEVAVKVAGLTEFRGTVEWGKHPRPLEPNFLDPNPRKIYSELGYRTRVGLNEGLAKTVAYWKQQLMKVPT